MTQRRDGGGDQDGDRLNPNTAAALVELIAQLADVLAQGKGGPVFALRTRTVTERLDYLADMESRADRPAWASDDDIPF